MNWLLRHCDAAATERLAAAINALLHPQAQVADQGPETHVMVTRKSEALAPAEHISMPTAVVALCAVLGDIVSTTEPRQQHMLVIGIGALLGANVNQCNLHRAAASLAAETVTEETRH